MEKKIGEDITFRSIMPAICKRIREDQYKRLINQKENKMELVSEFGRMSVTIWKDDIERNDKDQSHEWNISFTDGITNVNVILPEGKEVSVAMLMEFISRLQNGILTILNSSTEVLKAQMGNGVIGESQSFRANKNSDRISSRAKDEEGPILERIDVTGLNEEEKELVIQKTLANLIKKMEGENG